MALQCIAITHLTHRNITMHGYNTKKPWLYRDNKKQPNKTWLYYMKNA